MYDGENHEEIRRIFCLTKKYNANRDLSESDLMKIKSDNPIVQAEWESICAIMINKVMEAEFCEERIRENKKVLKGSFGYFASRTFLLKFL
jgi:hypothetical protein